MGSRGRVREWHDEEGWGVIDSPAAPGGCWAHYSAIEMDGYRALAAGEEVEVDLEAADQDGYAYRALTVRVPGRAEHSEVRRLDREQLRAFRSGFHVAFFPHDGEEWPAGEVDDLADAAASVLARGGSVDAAVEALRAALRSSRDEELQPDAARLARALEKLWRSVAGRVGDEA